MCRRRQARARTRASRWRAPGERGSHEALRLDAAALAHDGRLAEVLVVIGEEVVAPLADPGAGALDDFGRRVARCDMPRTARARPARNASRDTSSIGPVCRPWQ